MGEPRLSAEAMLFSLLNQRDWVLKTNLPHWLLIQLPSWRAVQWLVDNFGEVLGQWTRYRAPVYIEYSSHLFEWKQGELMELAISGIPANRELLDIFGLMLSSPERSLSLVHANSLRQFVVNAGQSGRFCLSVDPSEASTWKRNQYWLPESLGQFEIDWRRDWTPGEHWHEYTYLIDAAAPVEKRPVATPTHKLVTRYQLILGPNEAPFHLGENIAMEPVSP